ncbi:hypothetical protein ABZ470_39770 [Streptosporangium sp. NPDC020072]|uniref:hypothetical protein n=1 Tax=Streptosporangium sp. NPDC020072 TaxID=3154788 RepID=UPI003438F38A
MTRHDSTSLTGWVSWPTHLIDSREGGMAVYLVVAEDHEIPESFLACIPDTCVLLPFMTFPDCPAGDYREVWPEAGEYSTPLLAAMCLGGSGGCWTTPDGDHWECGYDDLSPSGKALFDALAVLYGRKPTILTVIDT